MTVAGSTPRFSDPRPETGEGGEGATAFAVTHALEVPVAHPLDPDSTIRHALPRPFARFRSLGGPCGYTNRRETPRGSCASWARGEVRERFQGPPPLGFQRPLGGGGEDGWVHPWCARALVPDVRNAYRGMGTTQTHGDTFRCARQRPVGRRVDDESCSAPPLSSARGVLRQGSAQGAPSWIGVHHRIHRPAGRCARLGRWAGSDHAPPHPSTRGALRPLVGQLRRRAHCGVVHTARTTASIDPRARRLPYEDPPVTT